MGHFFEQPGRKPRQEPGLPGYLGAGASGNIAHSKIAEPFTRPISSRWSIALSPIAGGAQDPLTARINSISLKITQSERFAHANFAPPPAGHLFQNISWNRILGVNAVLDELSVLSQPEYFWLNLIAFVGFVGFMLWTILRPRRQAREVTPVTQHRRAA